jgi:hypothetical protein
VSQTDTDRFSIADVRTTAEDAVKQDVDACWNALVSKLSSEKYVLPQPNVCFWLTVNRVDSLRHNKASPLQEIIGLLDRQQEKQAADAKG